MSWSCGLADKQCPICGSWDTSYATWNLDADLHCRPCGRTVWESTSNLPSGDVMTIERVYLADGSIRETAFEYDDGAMSLLLKKTDDEPNGSRRVSELADVWPPEKVKVRVLSANDVRSEEVAYYMAEAKKAICLLRGLIPPCDQAWEQVAAVLAEVSGFPAAPSKTAQPAQEGAS
jgi:hypothetical protein